MACGTPVIALRNDSVPEVASDGETDFMVESLEGTAVYQNPHRDDGASQLLHT